MKPITVNPYLKFGFLVFQIILIIFSQNSNVIILISLASLSYILSQRAKLSIIIRGLSFGLFLTIFIFVFSYIRYQNIDLAIIAGVDLLKIYFAMLLVSIGYKLSASNKEVAYVLSNVFRPLSLLGYDQNKLYTLFLMILNQSFIMFDSANRMNKYARFKKGRKLSIRESVYLIVPFINSNLKQNELLAIGLINSGYDPQIKAIKPYFIISYKKRHIFVMSFIVLIQVIILIKGA